MKCGQNLVHVCASLCLPASWRVNVCTIWIDFSCVLLTLSVEHRRCFTTSTLPIASHLQPPVHQRQHSLQYSAPERSRQLPTGGVFALRPEGFTDGGASGRSGAAGRKTSFMSWLPFKCKGPIVGGVRRVVGDKKDSVAKMAADAVERRQRLDTAEPSLPPPRSAMPDISPATGNEHEPSVGIQEQRQSE